MHDDPVLNSALGSRKRGRHEIHELSAGQRASSLRNTRATYSYPGHGYRDADNETASSRPPWVTISPSLNEEAGVARTYN